MAILAACVFGDLLSPKAVENLSVQILTDSLLTVGDTVKLLARAVAGTDPVAGVRIRFASTRPTTASVDDSGRVAVLARDTFAIRATLVSGSLAGEPPETTRVFRGIVARVVASADSIRFESLGDTLRLSAQGETKQGAAIPGVRITWSSSFPGAATVDSTGLVTAVANTAAPGLRIVASADGRVDTVRVRVQQVSRSITLSRDTVVLRNPGDTARVAAQPRDARGNVNTRSPTTWSSTDAAVFTVDSAGLVRAAGEGIALVVARSDAVADTGRVVVARGLLSLDVTPDSSMLTALSDQVILAATGVDEANNAVSSPVVLWRSLEPGVATVNASGVVTAASNGAAHIVGSSGGRDDTTVVVVDQVLAAVGIRRPVSDTTLTSLGDTMRVVAEGRDRNGFALPRDRCCAFTFSSDNASVASVDPGGLVTAHANGPASITAEAGGFLGSRVINVAQQVASVQVTPRRVSLTPGQWAQLNAAAFDARGNWIPGSGFNWVSRNTNVANPTSNGADTVSVQAGTVNDSTRVVASTGGRSDSAVVRVGNLAALCVGGTPHEGTIGAPEAWTRAQSPHCVAGSVLLRGSTLTIEAGATVKFAAGAEIQVGQCCASGQSARIRANGTAALPITFTALDANPTRGQWGGIRAHWVAPNDSLTFRNVVFEYGGAGNLATIARGNTCQGTVVLDAVTIRQGRNDAVRTSCSLNITNSVIENSGAKAVAAEGGTVRITGSRLRYNHQGLSIEGPASLATLTATRITGNADFGLMVTPQALNAIQDVLVDSLIGNGRDEIRVNGSGDLLARDLFVDRRLPWFLDGAGIGLGAGRTLTIDPSTTLRAAGGSTIWVGASSSDGSTDIGGGRIVADGSLGEIRITSGNTSPQPGDWGSIWIKRLSDTTVFRNVVLEYGGPCCTGGHIFAQHTGPALVLDRVTSRRSQLQGIRVDGPLIVQGPIYADSNASDGLEVHAPGVTIADSRFVGNGNNGVRAGPGASNLTIRTSELSKNGGDGAWLSGDNTVVQENLIAENGCSGLRIAPSGNNPANPVVSGNTIRANGCNGLDLVGSIGPRVDNNRIADNSGIGAVIHNGGTVFGNRIRGNQYPLQVNTAALGALASQDVDSLLGNQRDTLWIQCCGDVSASDTLRTSPNLPWRFDAPGTVRFVNSTVWKLEPGATVVMNGGVLQVDNATIRAEGEAGNPIRFTSDNPNPGAWSYLDFQARADTSVLRHVALRYGGGIGGTNFGLRVAGAPSNPVVLDNVRVTRSSAGGIQIDDETMIPTRVVADSNAGDGMRVQWGGGLVIPDGDFSYNGGHGLFATSDNADKIQIGGGTFSGNGRSGIKLCGDSATIRNATLARNYLSGLDVQGFNCPGGSSLEEYLVENVRADSNGNGITYLAGSSMRIRNSRVVRNAGTGVRVGVGVAEFTGNRVTLNGGYPISTGPRGVEALEDQNTDSMLGNTVDQVLIDQSGTIAARNVTIRQRLPWRNQAFLTIGGGRTLTVEPGTTVVMEGGGAGLWIGGGASGGQGQGRLLAEGTATDPIRFVAADTGNRWHVLGISEQSDTSKLRHVRIEHGGNSGWPGALTISDAMGRPVILDSVTVRQSAGVGISAVNVIAQGPVYADSNGGRGMVLYGRDVTLRDSRFVGNGSDGLWSAESARKLTIRRSLFYRNSGMGVQLNGDSTTIDSTTIRRNGSGVSFCCDGNNPNRPSVLRSVVDSNTAGGVSTSGSTNGIIQSNQIIANGGVGLTHHNGGLVAGNRIRGNRSPLNVNADALGAITGQSIDSLLGNTGDTLTVECCSGEEVIATDTIRTRPQLPWRIDVPLRFINRTVWKLEPGSSVFLNGGRIQIGQNPPCTPATQGAVLRAVSDDTAPIRFTSRNQSRGAWAQILLECLSDTVTLRNVEIGYAGAGGDNAVRIAPGTAAVPVILDSVRVRQSGGHGLLIQNGSNVTVRRYLAADSTSGVGLYVEPDGLSVPAGRFVGNGAEGINAYGRRFSLTSATVTGNGGVGVGLNADSASITTSTIAFNGGSGILAYSSAGGHVLSGITVQNNAGDGIRLLTSSNRVTSNSVTGNGGNGVFGDQDLTFAEFSGNTITGNGAYPVVMDGPSLGAFAAQDQTALLGNTRDTLCICSGPGSAPFTTGSPTVTAALPWRIANIGVIVGGDQALTLEAGATIVMENGSLFVGRGDGAYRGRLIAQGTAANPVRIVGPDTTTRGSWQQVAIENQSDSSILRHVVLIGGGGVGQQALYAGDLAGRPIRLDTVRVRKSGKHGVWFGGGPFRINALTSSDNDSSGVILTGPGVTITNSRFENNGQAGIRTDGSPQTISNSILANNLMWGLLNLTGTVVSATMNWWGAPCGPVHSSNPGCTGTNAVSDNVDFSSPLGAPPPIP